MSMTPAATAPGVGPWRGGDHPKGFEPFPDEAMRGSVVDRFLAVADSNSDATAISSPAATLTYGQLAEQVRRTAAGLIDRLGSDTPLPVGVLADHDGPLVATILSVVAAGHIVVVLDPTAPAEQVDHVLVESGMALVVHDGPQTDAAEALADRHDAVSVVEVDALAGEPVELPRRGPDEPIMLAFTSGTSGSPKGGIVTHGVILNVVRGATNALGVTAADRMPMLFPTSLAVAAYPMFIPLLNGGCLATFDARSDFPNLPEFLARERITLAYMAPTVVRFLVDAVGDRTFPDLRMIALGGELVDAEVVRLTHDLFAPRLMANGFGTTETGVISLYVFDPTDQLEGTVPSGYPVEEVELIMLDDEGRPVEPGGSGEIAVSSPHVFNGYWGHDELNRAVLSEDPGGRDGWRLYRTGDLGRLDEHGALVVMGRLDTKVKVRGRFVVLGDVEASLHELDAVADAAVVPTRREGNVELVAVVVPADAGTVDTTALRSELLERNEAYRVPARWIVVPELPRLPNGKVDRRALPVPDESDRTTGSEPSSSAGGAEARVAVAAVAGVDPSTVQRTLRDIWELLLPVDVVGPDTDFIAAGGDSLLAAQMLIMAEQRLGVTVPMGELVHARTLADLSDVVNRIQLEAPTTTVSCLQVGDESLRPRLWFVHDLQGSAYRVRHLAQHLGPDQPVWSFESPLLAGEPNDFSSLDTFVANYLTDLVAAQPEGPYWLAGYSFGGICAYEMARQLHRDGREVAFVGVVDVGPGYRGPGWSDRFSPFRPWFGVEKPPAEDATIREQLEHYREMAKRSPSGLARHLMVRSGLSRVVDPLRFNVDLRRDGRVRPEWRLWYAWEQHWKLAAQAWQRDSSYDGAVDLFWVNDTGSADATMGWGPLVDELHIHRFEGDHLGLLEPRGAGQLATALRATLDERARQAKG